MANLAQKNISLNDLKLDKFDSRYLFVAILVVLLALEAWVVKSSVEAVFAIKEQPVAAESAGAGINFKDYDAIITRIKNAADYKPTTTPVGNPFQ